MLIDAKREFWQRRLAPAVERVAQLDPVTLAETTLVLGVFVATLDDPTLDPDRRLATAMRAARTLPDLARVVRIAAEVKAGLPKVDGFE